MFGVSFIEYMLATNEFHSGGRALRMQVVSYEFEIVSSSACNWSLNWDILTKYEVMSSSNDTISFYKWLLKDIFCPKVLIGYNFVNIS